jgi:hypothetical protein
MMSFWGVLIFLVVVGAGSLWLGSVLAERTFGREAANRNLRSAIPLLLLAFALGFPLGFVIFSLGRNGRISFFILSAAGMSAWLISWFFRKQAAGSLLADIGRNSQNKFMFWVGLIMIAFLVPLTWFSFPRSSISLETKSVLVYLCSSASFNIAIGLSKLEFRENGICFMCSFTKWQKINSYTWESAKPNVLTIRVKPFFPLLPGFMSIVIPAKHKDVVDRILNERLPDKNL